jgi:hypothetical protein
MNETVHRVLMGVSGFCVAMAGLIGGSNLIDPQVASWIAFAGGATLIAANQIRVYWPSKPSQP